MGRGGGCLQTASIRPQSTPTGDLACACHDGGVTGASRTEGSRAEAFVWSTLNASVVTILDHHSIGADNMDPEVLHRFRVAVRRLRSSLRSLAPLLDRAQADALRTRLEDLDELLRPVRDGEVLVERLTSTAADVTSRVDADVVEWIHQRLVERTELARTQLLAGLQQTAFLGLVEDLRSLRSSGLIVPVPDASFEELLQQMNQRAWQRVRQLANSLSREAADVELHRVRILAKRSRYLAEASAPLLGRSSSRLAAAATTIQTVLGEHQDSVVLSQALIDLPQSTAANAATVSALLAVESEARTRIRRRWRRSWRRLNRLHR